MRLGYRNTLTLPPCAQKNPGLHKQGMDKLDKPPALKGSAIIPATHANWQRRIHVDCIYQRCWRQVLPEFRANNPTITMRPNNLAPYATEQCVVLLSLPLVNIGQSLPEIPIHFLLCVHPLNLQKRGARVLIGFRPIRRSEASEWTHQNRVTKSHHNQNA